MFMYVWIFFFRIATIKKKKTQLHTTGFFAVTNPSRSDWAVQAVLPAWTRRGELKAEQKQNKNSAKIHFIIF